MINTEVLHQLTEMVATLNLESTTTIQIVDRVMPLLYWHFVWSPIINVTLMTFLFSIILVSSYKLIKD